MSSNKSFVLKKAGHVEYEDRPVPDIQDPYDVRVQVKFTGICGSDVHYWHDGELGGFVVEDPMVLGHESSGIVSQVGKRVTTLKVGDEVAMEPGIPCRRCVRCKDGKYNLCPSMAFAATPPYDGTLAKYYILPEDFCYKLPASMSLEEGALIEPLSVAVHVVKQAEVKPKWKVVVFGAGPVGLLCCAVAHSFGATKIICADVNEDRLKFAKEYAATHVWAPQREAPEASAKRLVAACELGDGADVIIDATGAEPCIQTSLYALRTGGTFVQAGMGKPDISWPIGVMSTKELKVLGSFRYNSGDYATAVDLVANGRISVKELISTRVKFEDAEQAFKDTKAAKGIKTLILGPEG